MINKATHGILTDEDMQKLARLRNESVAAICVSDDSYLKIAEAVIDADSKWTDETFAKVARSLDALNERVDGEKTADALTTFQKILGGIGVASLAAIPATRAVQAIKSNRELKNSWEDVRQIAEIKSNPNSINNWTVLEDFAPDVAANSTAAEAMLKTMNEYGTVSPKMIADLINMQHGVSQQRVGFGGPLDPMKALTAVGGLHG